jgi:cytidine deaminase
LSNDEKALLAEAQAALANSHAPYSEFASAPRCARRRARCFAA